MTTQRLEALGRCMVKTLERESKKYFAKRGWSGRDPAGGPDIWDSYSFKVVGTDLEIRSTFYGMKELAHGSVPERRMTWLTQEHKKQKPSDFKLTPREKELGMKRGSKHRLPLIVPIETTGGNVEFRSAPLKVGDAWIHPGIAKFTFFETAIRNGRKACADLIRGMK